MATWRFFFSWLFSQLWSNFIFIFCLQSIKLSWLLLITPSPSKAYQRRMPSANGSFFLAIAFGNPSSPPAQLLGRDDKVMPNTAVLSMVITGWGGKFSWGISSWRSSQRVTPDLHARWNGTVRRSKFQGLGVQPYHCKFIFTMKHAFPSMTSCY